MEERRVAHIDEELLNYIKILVAQVQIFIILDIVKMKL